MSVHRYLGMDEILTSLPSPAAFGVEQIVAFEDHEHFAYIYGTSRYGAPPSAVSEPCLLRRVYFVRPGWLVIDDQVNAARADAITWTLHAHGLTNAAPQEVVGDHKGLHYHGRCLFPHATAWNVNENNDRSTSARHELRPRTVESVAWLRAIHIVTFATDRPPVLPVCTIKRLSDVIRLELVEQDGTQATGRTVRLSLPDGTVIGRIEIIGDDGAATVPDRLLPAGILPPDIGAAKRRLQWDLPYQIEGQAIWDTGHASSQLRRMIESGQIVPCRALELGCGTGSDAIYLASKGFDVTAIDISPTALNIAQRKATQAGVQVAWLLADILHPPQLLKPFDFVYDRGCYHEVRQHHAKEYVAALRSFTHPGSKILILAASANKDTYWRFEGPPRVRESAIRNDFATDFRLADLHEFRFDPTPPERAGALAWSILLTREPADPTMDSHVSP